MEISYSKTAVKSINVLDTKTKKRIKEGIEKLTHLPPLGDIKQMEGSNGQHFRLRVGKYRIIYEYTFIEGNKSLIIIDIGSRGDIYK